MPKEIYNEGRVVGLSAWEIFCRNVLEHDPTATVPSEHTWLASSIGSGASMILKLPSGTSAGVHTYALPKDSTLSAAGVIVASPFIGKCTWDGNWANKVISYGGLIQNDDIKSPTSDDIPYKNSFIEDESVDRKALAEYLKVQDGIVYQQGTWVNRTLPKKDLINPNFKSYNGTVRLYISKALTQDVCVLLTGFTDKWVLSGISGLTSGSTDISNNEWQNGGMLGPAIFPWASKIIFTVPSASYAFAKSYARTFPSDKAITVTKIGQFDFSKVSGEVNSNPIVDMNSADPLRYYEINGATSNCIKQTIPSNQLNFGLADSYASLITWYPGMTASRINSLSESDTKYVFPPALYGVKVTADGDRLAAPIDTAAPGTVKVFKTQERTAAYVNQLPDNYAIYHDTTKNGYYIIDKSISSNVNSWQAMNSKVSVSKVGNALILSTTAGSDTRTSLAMCDPNGNSLALTGTNGKITIGPSGTNANGITWNLLTDALSGNKTIDVLGNELRTFGAKLPNVTVSGTSVVQFDGATIKQANSSVSGSTKKEIVFSVAPKSGTNYIVFSNGLRLYISSSKPTDTDVPVGSIGIGW